MGRRASKHRFVPHYYVFPGGRLDRADYDAAVLSPLRGEVLEQMSCLDRTAQALAVAAARETLEETGLVLGQANAPKLDPLDYVIRAITPSSSPYRFHARFFAVDADHLAGTLEGNGELLDLGWRTLEECLRLPIVDVTEYLLRRFLAEQRIAFRKDARLFSFRTGRVLIK